MAECSYTEQKKTATNLHFSRTAKQERQSFRLWRMPFLIRPNVTRMNFICSTLFILLHSNEVFANLYQSNITAKNNAILSSNYYQQDGRSICLVYRDHYFELAICHKTSYLTVPSVDVDVIFFLGEDFLR